MIEMTLSSRLSHVDGEETFFVSFKPPRPGAEPPTLAWKAAVLTTTLGPPPSSYGTYMPCFTTQRKSEHWLIIRVTPGNKYPFLWRISTLSTSRPMNTDGYSGTLSALCIWDQHSKFNNRLVPWCTSSLQVKTNYVQNIGAIHVCTG